MKLRKAIIVAYFGELPNYAKLFLDSCGHNGDYNFILITDQAVSYAIPQNVELINMPFEELQGLVGKKLGPEYRINSPYKLCDYRPAYGMIFEDYIAGYDVWGYCDMDLIFGDISKFITEKDFREFDRLLTNGHLCFYRNTDRVNSYYASDILGYVNFRRATSFDEPFFFDEVFSTMILSRKGVPIFKSNSYLDVLPQKFEMKVKEMGELKNYTNQKFIYHDGRVYHSYEYLGGTTEKEYMYIHLQKRTMQVSKYIDINKAIYINPNIFTPYSDDISGKDNFKYKLNYTLKQLKKISLNRILIKLLVIMYTKKYRGGVG